jgi:hypothetical protein
MRHLWTLIAAIVIAPAAWLLIAFGQTQSVTAFGKAVTSGAWPAGDFVAPLLLLAGAGILLGLIGTLRFSPLGAVLTGLVYVASFAAVMIDGKDVYKLLNHDISLFNRSANLTTPVGTGLTLVVGALLLVSVASLSRWRRGPVNVTEPAAGEPSPLGEPGTDEASRDFWTPTTPVTTPLGAPYHEESTTEHVPGQFGSPWRTPPGENATDERA